MGLGGYLVASLFGQGDTYMVNQMTGRGGLGTTLMDGMWAGLTGTPGLDSALAGGRMKATMMRMMGMSPTMMAMYTNPQMLMFAEHPFLAQMMMNGGGCFGMNQLPYNRPYYGSW
jgi:hypothetical protein